MNIHRIICLLLLAWGCAHLGGAQPTESVGIPMRDGKALAADIYLPNNQDTFPTILIMTPYGKFFYALNGLPLGIGKNLTSSKYAVVVVDWRCRFASLSACAIDGDNGRDGFDVVEWIAGQPWSTGKIGMWGPSALGNVQFETAAEQPPHLMCCVPEVAAPHFSYDKYYPGGVLKVETVETLNALFGFTAPIINNPHYNLIWQIAENASMYPDQIAVPFMIVGGWYDQNTDQALRMYDTLKVASDPSVRSQHRLLIGPWVHGGTGQAFVGSAIQGELTYPSAEGANIEAALAFFDFHLRDLQPFIEPAEVTFFQMGDDAWQTSEVWPPAGTESIKFYLHENASLSEDIPHEKAAMSFQYDPEDPSPSVGGKSLNLALAQGPHDQRPEVEAREDALIFDIPVLQDPMIIQGAIQVHLHLESDRKDTDVAVRITDVYPDGRSMLLIDGIRRLRFRDGYRIQDTAFMQRGEVYSVNLVLDDLAITILPGHKLRLIITSSNYPRYNRNMNNGGVLHPDGDGDTLVNPMVAENIVHLSSEYPSHISLPLVQSSTASRQEVHLVWSLSPNPSGSGRVHLHKPIGVAQVQITDTYGRTLRVLKTIAAERMDLDTSDLDPGVYYFQLRIGDQVSVNKVLIL